MNLNEKAGIIVKSLEDKKGINIKVIDSSKISVMADYLIIAGGSSKNQVQALADDVEEKLLEVDVKTGHIEGYANANWILLDYGDIIVHVFNQEDRLFYDLERLWQDGITVDLEEIKN